jgi:hypothetical protein
VGDYFRLPERQILLTRAYRIADILQPASYSPVRATTSLMAGGAGTDRWVMTGGIFLAAAATSSPLRA